MFDSGRKDTFLKKVIYHKGITSILKQGQYFAWHLITDPLWNFLLFLSSLSILVNSVLYFVQVPNSSVGCDRQFDLTLFIRTQQFCCIPIRCDIFRWTDYSGVHHGWDLVAYSSIFGHSLGCQCTVNRDRLWCLVEMESLVTSYFIWVNLTKLQCLSYTGNGILKTLGKSAKIYRTEIYIYIYILRKGCRNSPPALVYPYPAHLYPYCTCVVCSYL